MLENIQPKYLITCRFLFYEQRIKTIYFYSKYIIQQYILEILEIYQSFYLLTHTFKTILLRL